MSKNSIQNSSPLEFLFSGSDKSDPYKNCCSVVLRSHCFPLSPLNPDLSGDSSSPDITVNPLGLEKQESDEGIKEASLEAGFF